jgi:hypothetical protein
MKNSELAARVVGDINALTKDQHVSRRQIMAIAQQKTGSYIAQRLADGTLYGDEDLFTRITCFEMEKVNTVACPFTELRNCRILMKSKKPLPKLIYSKTGASVRSVTTIDDQTIFYPSNLNKASLQRNLPYGYITINSYYILDNYLYIPDVPVEAVNIVVLTQDQVDTDDGDCQCKSYWDYNFVCPEKIRENVIQETTKEVMIRLGIVVDENPNLDSNQKSSPQQ